MQQQVRPAVLVAAAVATVVALGIGLLGWVSATDESTSARPAAPSAGPPAATPSGQPSEAARTLAAGSPGKTGCDEVARPFAPVTISIPGVARDVPVVTPPRDANGVPGVPPLSEGGKWVFAWDREQGIRPGDPRGNVLLNTHTWPDGTALGNHLLDGLEVGDRIVLEGRRSALCYRVTEEVEVAAAVGLARYYDTEGPPQIAIVVCSGRRLGPGRWENRTVWFAEPSV